mgnify:CR=1 FL=1
MNDLERSKGVSMRTENDIQELNLSYLFFIQRLAKEDFEKALEVTGLEGSVIDEIATLSIIDVTRLSRCGVLLMGFRGDVGQFRKAASNARVEERIQDIHLSMMMLSEGRHQ